MKKLLIVIPILFVLFTILVLVIIPGKIVITESKVVGTTADGFDTCLHNLQKWRLWWPGKYSSSVTDSLFTFNKGTYKLTDIFTDGGAIQIRSNNLLFDTKMRSVPQNRDSITAEWRIVVPTGNDPFTRLKRSLYASELRKSVQAIFDSLCQFAGKTENIYGFAIKRTTFTEVNLIAYRFKSIGYPRTEILYSAVNKLRQYLISQGVSEKYYPMTNTKKIDSAQYETMVAISVSKLIPAKDDFFISQMVPMKDRFLATEVRGGPARLEQAHIAVEKYMSDHSLSAPARPFEILVTDRNKETDTANWRTIIYYPSM
jgi:hypothetical protein